MSLRSILIALALVAAACSTAESSAPPTIPVPGATSSPASTSTPPPTDALATTTTTPTANTHPASAALDEALTAWAESRSPMGVVALVTSGDETVWQATAGDPAASVDGLFEVGSITKTLVAITALRLAEDGRIDLDAPIAAYAESVAPSSTTTLRELLSHTAGLIDPEVDTSLESLLDLTRIYTPQELVETTLEGVGTLIPGRYRYSNSGYWLAGAALAEAGEAPLEVLIREMVLDPLDLEDTYLAWSEPVPRPLVPGYVAFTADGGELPLGTEVIPAMVTGAWSAGGVVSTAPDIARLFAALFEGDLIQPTSLDELLDLPDGSDYGLGIERRTANGNDAWGHNGVIAGYRSSAIHDPDTGFTVVVLTNRLRPDFDTEPIASQLLAIAAGR